MSKRKRIKNKLYIVACLMGIAVCILKLLPAAGYPLDIAMSDISIIGLCATSAYLAGYCVYRAIVAIHVYMTYSDLR